jgi:hypothetical protein
MLGVDMEYLLRYCVGFIFIDEQSSQILICSIRTLLWVYSS